jgi:acetylcholinesterase
MQLIDMREGIPHWPPYTHEKKEFMAINKYWSVKNYYTLVISQKKIDIVIS